MHQTQRITVKGKVQGVYFRQRTFETASALGITGSVRNLDDGSVEIIATGSESALQQLTEWCHKGPSRAKVQQVNIDLLPLSNDTTFTILR